MAADLHSLPSVTSLGRHEFDAAVAVLVVVPIDERSHPLTSLLFGGKWLAGVIRPILHRSEQRFRVRVVVRHPWPGEGSEDAQFLQPAFQRGRTHGVAVIGMEDQPRTRGSACGACSSMGARLQGRYPASEVKGGARPEKPDHLSLSRISFASIQEVTSKRS